MRWKKGMRWWRWLATSRCLSRNLTRSHAVTRFWVHWTELRRLVDRLTPTPSTTGRSNHRICFWIVVHASKRIARIKPVTL